MTTSRTALKDPAARKDWSIDWSAWLAGDTILTSTWTTADGSGINVDTSSHTTTATRVWLSGGALGGPYRVTNHIVTAAGREDDRSFVFTITEQ